MKLYFLPMEYTPINKWNEDDRPREKLLNKGRSALSDSELIAILIGSGTRNESAVELARKVLSLCQNNLNELAGLSLKELITVKGIGEAKAITISAALELGRRRKEGEWQEKPQLQSSRDAYNQLWPHMADLDHEQFWILLLNRANKVLSAKKVSQGGMTGTVADPKLIFKTAIENDACYIILCHNHPSGNLKPSQADLDLTKKLKEAGKLLEIPVLDHIIVAAGKYYSFADEGIL